MIDGGSRPPLAGEFPVGHVRAWQAAGSGGCGRSTRTHLLTILTSTKRTRTYREDMPLT